MLLIVVLMVCLVCLTKVSSLAKKPSGPSQVSKMDFFERIVSDIKTTLLAIFCKTQNVSKYMSKFSKFFRHVAMLVISKYLLAFRNQMLLSLREKCPNTELFLVRIQSECRNIRTRNNSVFGHFSRSVLLQKCIGNK